MRSGGIVCPVGGGVTPTKAAFTTTAAQIKTKSRRGLQRGEMISDNAGFKKSSVSSGRRGGASREVRRAGSHVPGGGGLTHSNAGQKEQRGAEGSRSPAPATGSGRRVVAAGERVESMQGLGADQSQQVPALLTQQLPPASAQDSAIKTASNDGTASIDAREPRLIRSRGDS